jgi:1,4-dihydroxy-2-naphthoyl-CoA hydrolase
MNGGDFEYAFHVRLHDTDAAGVLFFAHLFRYAHDAYEAFMEHAGLDLAGLIAAGRVHLPLVHAEADYLAPLRHGEAVRVRLAAERLGTRAFTLAYDFTGVDGASRARARTAHVAVDPKDGAARPLPPELRVALERLPRLPPAA